MVDQSWWCGYGPTDKTPELVVCVVIENGGHGSTAAAPAALKIFERHFGLEAPVVETGVETD
jgi:penicillin-binding protein 2